MSGLIQPSDFLEILTTEELLRRLKIGRTKLFELKRNGTLKPGRHFFKNGRILRFVWRSDLIEAIDETQIAESTQTNRPYKKPTTKTVHANKRTPINLSY